MKRLVIISGPQAAGKSTSIGKINDLLRYRLGEKYVVPFVLQEARQIIVHKYHSMGAIFLDIEHEKEIIETDFFRMEKILSEIDDSLIYLDECNVFTLAHAKAHGEDLSDLFFDKYIDYLKRLNAVVVYIDLDPDISWRRREQSYRSRLFRFPEEEREGILTRYFEYLRRLHPELKNVFEKIRLPKIVIDGNDTVDNTVRSIFCFLRDNNVI